MLTTDRTRARMAAWLPWVWSLMLGVLLLGPALGPGYVLSYDMVWVPDLALRSDFLGVGSALPRAVPSDAVVAVVDEVVPGMLLQKAVLLGALVAAGVGAARLVRDGVPDLGLAAQLGAATVMVWNPFVVERLVLGHWPVLVGYAVLPWAVRAARSARSGASLLALAVLVPLGSLSAGAGLVTSLAVLVFGWSAVARRNVGLVALVLLGNAPWVVAGLLHAGDATSDPAAGALFALRGEGHLPAPLAALGLGGVWNAEVVPATREGILAVVMTVLLVGVAAAGVLRWWGGSDPRDRAGLLGTWAVGWGLAVLSWAAPDLIGWVAEQFPGGGLFRDGSRFLALCAPLLVVLFAHGVAVVQAAIRDRFVAGVVTAGLLLAPLALMPDAAWGVSGTLDPTDYPQGYADAARAIGTHDRTGDVVVLPFSAYRAPEWNGRHKVLDPLPRYLPGNYVASDRLVVGDRPIAGEDPRVRAVERALALADPEQRSAALARIGVRFVVTDASGPGPAPEVAGRELVGGGTVEVVALDSVTARRTPPSWGWWMAAAWVGFVSPSVVALTGAAARRIRRNR